MFRGLGYRTKRLPAIPRIEPIVLGAVGARATGVRNLDVSSLWRLWMFELRLPRFRGYGFCNVEAGVESCFLGRVPHCNTCI